jgi:hypothetical protein
MDRRPQRPEPRSNVHPTDICPAKSGSVDSDSASNVVFCVLSVLLVGALDVHGHGFMRDLFLDDMNSRSRSGALSFTRRDSHPARLGEPCQRTAGAALAASGAALHERNIPIDLQNRISQS